MNLSLEYKNEPKDTSNNILFKDVEYIHDQKLGQNQSIIFARIGNETLNYDNNEYQLFYLRKGDFNIVGYWGIKSDSIMYIPYSQRNCPIEYLIFDPKQNGYYEISNKNSCYSNKYPFVGESYFYKIVNTDGENFDLKFYPFPEKMVNITEKDYMEVTNPLKMKLNLSRGVLDFNYKFNIHKENLIPWAISNVQLEKINKEYFK